MRKDGDWLDDLKIKWSRQDSGQNPYRNALKVQRGLRGEDVTFCFIGDLALEHWGNVRRPVNLGVNVFCCLDQKSDVLEKLSRGVDPRIDQIDYLVKNARMYLGISENQTDTDISLGYTRYENRVMERSVDVDFSIEEPL